MNGLMFRVVPWQLMPEPYVLVNCREGTTCTAWFVTEPELLATGAAVLETWAWAGADTSKRAARNRFIE